VENAPAALRKAGIMGELSRRRFLQVTGAAGATVLVPLRFPEGAGAVTRLRGSLAPATIRKYAADLVVPPQMPFTTRGGTDHYRIATRQFRQQILPRGLPTTTVWGYGSVDHPGSFHSPAFTIEARHGRRVRVQWINGLVDEAGNFRRHLLPVDPTLFWANPPGGTAGRDSEPSFDSTPGRYEGPVPIVSHLHGGHSRDHSDGYPEAWYLPQAGNIPSGFARYGSFYEFFRQRSPLGDEWTPGSAVFEYLNDQPATTLWYHDHTLGLTRLNVYAGLAGFYLLRGGPGTLPAGVLPGPAPRLGDHSRTRHYEIPLGIQDRSFNSDGSLFYPSSREFFDDFAGPYLPDSDVPPIWNPEFFGETMMVNGRTWPLLMVEPRRYRFRVLNGCNSRFLILKIASHATRRPAETALPVWMIGSEGGFLPAPVRLDRVLLGPGERADTIVDFTGLRPGTELYLVNLGPDEPFGEVTDPPEPFADPATTGQVMKFRVMPLQSRDTSTPPDRLTLPALDALGAVSLTRRLSLNEKASALPFGGPVEAKLGIVDDTGPRALDFDDPVTEQPALGATEIWELHNFTADAHPIHLHLVQFHMVDRQSMDGGPARGPEPQERGFKDTVIAYPGQITRLKAQFDLPGRYLWHCHILEHEDNEMMRAYQVGPIAPGTPT
jgi:FtsP/CotA-like multicopper oxidase with cupredoxin domain